MKYKHFIILKNIFLSIAALFILLLFFTDIFLLDKKNEIKNQNQGKYDILFDHSKLHEVEFKFTKEEWDGLQQDMLDHYKLFGHYRTGNYRKIKFFYKGEAGNISLDDVGIRLQGRNTRKLIQKEDGTYQHVNFKIKFNDTFDLKENTKEYEEIKDRRFFKLRGLILKHRDYDISQIRDLYIYDLHNRVGVYASKTGSVKLYITIDKKKYYWGIYTIIEPVDKSFLTKRYGKEYNDGNIYECGPEGSLNIESIKSDRSIGVKDWRIDYQPTYILKTNEDNLNYNDLKSFIYNLNLLEGEELKKYLDNNFEIDSLLKQLALNVLIGHVDDYRCNARNYYLYFTDNHKINFIQYDFDRTLGNRWHYDNIDIFKWFKLDEIEQGKQINHPLTDKVLQIEEYKAKYINYLKYLIDPKNNLFVYSDYRRRFRNIKKLYLPYLNNDINNSEKMKNNVQVENFFYKRTKSIVDQLGLKEEDYEIKLNSSFFKFKMLLNNIAGKIQEIRNNLKIRTRIKKIFKLNK